MLLKSNPGHFGGGHVPLPTLYNFINCTLIVSNLSMHFWTSWTRKLILIVFHKALVFQSFFLIYHSLDTCFFTLIFCVHESWLTKNKNIWGKIGESSSKLIIFLDSKLRSHGIRLNSLHFWGSRIQSQVEFHESLVTTNFWVVLYMYFKSGLSLFFFYLSYNKATILMSRLTENGAIGPI